MPGHAQLSIEGALAECREAVSLGIGGVILFGIPSRKGRKSVRSLRRQRHRAAGDSRHQARVSRQLLVVTDVCNCEYTSHGHCGMVVDNDVDNDVTLEWLARVRASRTPAPEPISLRHPT